MTDPLDIPDLVLPTDEAEFASEPPVEPEIVQTDSDVSYAPDHALAPGDGS